MFVNSGIHVSSKEWCFVPEINIKTVGWLNLENAILSENKISH